MQYGGEITSAYGWTAVNAPGGLPLRVHIDNERRDPFEFVALRASNLKRYAGRLSSRHFLSSPDLTPISPRSRPDLPAPWRTTRSSGSSRSTRRRTCASSSSRSIRCAKQAHRLSAFLLAASTPPNTLASEHSPPTTLASSPVPPPHPCRFDVSSPPEHDLRERRRHRGRPRGRLRSEITSRLLLMASECFRVLPVASDGF